MPPEELEREGGAPRPVPHHQRSLREREESQQGEVGAHQRSSWSLPRFATRAHGSRGSGWIHTLCHRIHALGGSKGCHRCRCSSSGRGAATGAARRVGRGATIASARRTASEGGGEGRGVGGRGGAYGWRGKRRGACRSVSV